MKVVLIIICALMVATCVYADSTNDGKFDNIVDKPILELLEHEHEYSTDKSHTPTGVGANIPLWKAEKFDVDAEVRIDTANGEQEYYAVVKPKMSKGLFQIVGDFFKGLGKE